MVVIKLDLVVGKDTLFNKLNINDIPKIKRYYNRLLSELIQLGFTKWKVNKTLLRVLGKRFGVGDRIIRNIINIMNLKLKRR